MYANIDYLKIIKGIHPEIGNHSGMQEAASKGVMFAMVANSSKGNIFAHRQFIFLVFGIF